MTDVIINPSLVPSRPSFFLRLQEEKAVPLFYCKRKNLGQLGSRLREPVDRMMISEKII